MITPMRDVTLATIPVLTLSILRLAEHANLILCMCLGPLRREAY